jgi:hypothetical protein
MWREAKADAIVSSIKGLVGGAAPTDTAFFDVCPVSGRAHDPWEQSFGHVDPWGDPGGISAFDPQYRVRNQLKSTVLKVLCKAAGMHEISWSAADRTLLGGLAEVYRTVEEKCSAGVNMRGGSVALSMPGAENLTYFVPGTVTSSGIFDETSQLKYRLARVERELFDMRNQVSRLVAQANTSFAPMQIVARAAYDPAAAWRKAVEQDGTTSPITNLEEIYE